jgi:DNA-binding PucR family transcriptional regulator
VPQVDLSMPLESNPIVADPFVQRVAQHLLDDLPTAVDQLIEHILAVDPFYASVIEVMADEVRASVEENLGQLVRGLAGHEPLDFELPRDLARRRAEQGVPVSALLHAYRLAGELVWERHVEAGKTMARDEFAVEQILDGAAKIWALTNLYCEIISQAYDDTTAERARRSERERTLLLDALFEGRMHDLPRLADTARLLDLPERATYVVVVAENPAPGEDGAPGAEQALRFQSMPSAWRLRSQRHIGVVVVGSGRGGKLEGLRTTLDACAVGRVGISPAFEGLADTARHVGLADLALSCLPLGGRGVVSFPDHPLALLVAGSPDLAYRIAESVLGPLLALDDREQHLLLETLEAWIACGGSTTEAAARLYCHRNTVRNRLQRIERLCARSLTNPGSIAEICAALTAVRTMPSGDGPGGPRTASAP